MAYEQIAGPLGNDRLDVLTAMITERITNTFRGRKSQAVPIAKFLPQWGLRNAEGEAGGDSQEPADPPGGHR